MFGYSGSEQRQEANKNSVYVTQIHKVLRYRSHAHTDAKAKMRTQMYAKTPTPTHRHTTQISTGKDNISIGYTHMLLSNWISEYVFVEGCF